jgi:hypothetical protein
METPVIKEIKKLRDDIKTSLETIDRTQYYSNNYGPESEYSGKGLYLGLEALLVDVSYLVKSHNIFISISTHSERNQIKNELTNIHSYLSSPQQLSQHIDILKTLLRTYNVRGNVDRWEHFTEVNKKLLEQSDQFAEVLKEVNTIRDTAEVAKDSIEEKIKEIADKLEVVEEKIQEVEEVKTEIEENSEKLKAVNIALEKIKTDADVNMEGIVESFNEAKANEKIINSFAQKVQERDNRLGELQQQTEENKQKLTDYENERIKILDEAKKLIESAKTALNYKTAEGISASFQTQHDDARKWQFSGTWIIAASIFIAIAIGLGVWILTEKADELHIIIGRIALIPLPILAAIFCANQYVKQKNIIEDYAYKMVLAKSIVGFSEQLKKDPSEDKGEYVHYMKVALEEIHKDPLRRRNNKITAAKTDNKIENFSIKDVVEMAERIVKIGKN